MQLITFLSAAAIVATASARTAVELNAESNKDEAYARVINRCDYDVYLWSVLKGDGCPTDGGHMMTLKKGESYMENTKNSTSDGKTGVSIKISKNQQCKGSDIVQLEYFLESDNPGYEYNYLDVSYVDCLGGDCPTKSEGYYLKAVGTDVSTASASNTWCPTLSCHDSASCAKCSYILPDDVQTKTCDLHSSMDFYMCGGQAPTEDDDSAAAPASSSKKVASSKPVPTSTKDDSYDVKAKAAAVTPAAEVKDTDKQGQKTKTKVEVVYVTAYEYVNAKRHVHGHARRHQNIHA